VVACSETRILLDLEIQRGKDKMPKRIKYHHEYGATVSFTVRGVEATQNIGRKEEEHRIHLFSYVSRFVSVKVCAEVGVRGHQGIGQVKTAKKLN
jgi:hypothetical protein